MTIVITKRITKYLRDETDNAKTPLDILESKIEKEVSEDIISSFELDSELSTALLSLLGGEDNYPEINKDGNLEVAKYLYTDYEDCREERELVIKFIK